MKFLKKIFGLFAKYFGYAFLVALVMGFFPNASVTNEDGTRQFKEGISDFILAAPIVLLFIPSLFRKYREKQRRNTQSSMYASFSEPVQYPRIMKNSYTLNFKDCKLAIDIMYDRDQVSASILERYLHLDFPSAYQIIQFFENSGIVSSSTGNVPRYFLVTQMQAYRFIEHYFFNHPSSQVHNGNYFPSFRCETSSHPLISSVDNMDGHAFEYWCADVLRHNGFYDVEVTPGSGDQGVDILAVKDNIRYAIQCKCYSSDLGNKPVQEVHAGKSMYRCQIGVVMTNRHFTKGAKDLAEATGVLLWDRDKLQKMIRDPNPTRLEDCIEHDGTPYRNNQKKNDKKISYIEKERYDIETLDINGAPYKSIPYQLNQPIEKVIQENIHPFAYMNLVGENQNIAIFEICKINAILSTAYSICSVIPPNVKIPIENLSFDPSSVSGYVRLIFTPKSMYGPRGKYPAHLSFSSGSIYDAESAHGELYYGANGNISEAHVNYWANRNGFFLTYKAVDGELTLTKAECTNKKSTSCTKQVIFPN